MYLVLPAGTKTSFTPLPAIHYGSNGVATARPHILRAPAMCGRAVRTPYRWCQHENYCAAPDGAWRGAGRSLL